MKKTAHILSLFACAMLLLSACSQRGTTTNQTSGGTEPSTNSAPKPQSGASSALTSPLNSPPSNGSKGVPTPAPARAAVAGRIIPNPPTTYSLEGVTIFFGTRLPLTPGPDFLINMSPQTSPKAVLDKDGFFAIADLPPGEYAMVLWSPHNSVMIGEKQDPDKIMSLKVSAGQQLDLGAIISKMP
ncbi:MAG: hypothetical protein WCL57_15490 [Chloroflexota bacterium]|nr:hypothetical protein [Chloroflexota bacterium]